MKVTEPGADPPRQEASDLPVLRLGFRPFYLGGAFFGSLAIAFWLFALQGYPVAGRSAALSGLLWHAHEMIFGFVAAIVHAGACTTRYQCRNAISDGMTRPREGTTT